MSKGEKEGRGRGAEEEAIQCYSKLFTPESIESNPNSNFHPGQSDSNLNSYANRVQLVFNPNKSQVGFNPTHTGSDHTLDPSPIQSRIQSGTIRFQSQLGFNPSSTRIQSESDTNSDSIRFNPNPVTIGIQSTFNPNQ